MSSKFKFLISFISVFLVFSVIACSIFVIVDRKDIAGTNSSSSNSYNGEDKSFAEDDTSSEESGETSSVEETSSGAESESSSSDSSSSSETSSEEEEIPPPHTHNYTVFQTVAPTCTNGGYTVYKCSCGDSYRGNELSAKGHSWGIWETTKAATTVSEGEETRKCKNCTEKETRKTEKLPTPPPQTDNYEYIMGENVYSADHLASFAVSLLGGDTSKVSLYCSLYEIATIYLEEGAVEGVRGDIAFCQALIETGVFKYGNDVKWTQNNFCGLGATGNGVAGNSFPDVRTGVRAHIQHLVSYATTKSKYELKNPCVDPRFVHGYRGLAPKWTDLTGRWATDPTYGPKITAMYLRMAETPINDAYLAKSKIKVEK